MTAENKAKELFDKFLDEMPKYLQGNLGRKTAKNQCLIAVEEIIQSYPTFVETWQNSKGINVAHVDNRKFWQEVKQEINKL